VSLDEIRVLLERVLCVLHGLRPLLLVEVAERAVRVVVGHGGVLEDGLRVAVHGRVVLTEAKMLVASVLELLVAVVLARGRRHLGAVEGGGGRRGRGIKVASRETDSKEQTHPVSSDERSELESRGTCTSSKHQKMSPTRFSLLDLLTLISRNVGRLGENPNHRRKRNVSLFGFTSLPYFCPQGLMDEKEKTNWVKSQQKIDTFFPECALFYLTINTACVFVNVQIHDIILLYCLPFFFLIASEGQFLLIICAPCFLCPLGLQLTGRAAAALFGCRCCLSVSVRSAIDSGDCD
jgi:hypothetical protein